MPTLSRPPTHCFFVGVFNKERKPGREPILNLPVLYSKKNVCLKARRDRKWPSEDVKKGEPGFLREP